MKIAHSGSIPKINLDSKTEIGENVFYPCSLCGVRRPVGMSTGRCSVN